MKEKIWIGLFMCLTFALGILVASYAVTRGPGGQAKLVLGNFSYEITINEIDLPSLISNSKDNDAIRKTAMRSFSLYDIDGNLIQAISKLSYDNAFSHELRRLRDRFVGPFNAPEVNVEVKFDGGLNESKAQVCPDSVFYKERVNIALSDFSKMMPIEDAGIALSFGCPPPQDGPEPIIISDVIGKKLLNSNQLPESISAVAKVLPSYVIIQRDQEGGSL